MKKEKRTRIYAETPDAVQDLRQKKSSMLFGRHDLVDERNSSGHVLHCAIEICAAADFLLDELVDEVGVLC